MPRIQPTTVEQAPESTRETIKGVKSKMGRVPNLFATLAKSPAALNSYFKQKEALATGKLGDKFGESLALAIANFSGCAYCASAHYAIGEKVGISQEERDLNRKGQSSDPKTQAAIDLAKSIVETRGWSSDEAFESAKKAGLSEEEILEVLAITTFNLFTNYANHFIETENDFPAVELNETLAV
ncbi:MAG: carboxymuconolactone decarboxylase family protein [Phycisphaerales bacterium]